MNNPKIKIVFSTVARLIISRICRHRWELVIWALLAVYLFWHAHTWLGILQASAPGHLDGMSSRIPFRDTDDCEWLNHARTAIHTGNYRPRFVADDFVPTGRPMDWPSANLWWIIFAAHCTRLVTGFPIERALEVGAVFCNAAYFSLYLLLGIPFLRRTCGRGGTILVMLLAVTNEIVSSPFHPAHPDHHGLILGVSAAFMLAVWSATRDRWRTDPALWVGAIGAIGLWLSPLSFVPIIGVSLSAYILGLVLNPKPRNASQPRWRTAAWIGGMATFGFYVLEYFPFQTARIRFECVNPFYAVAFASGVTLVAFFEKAFAGSAWQPLSHRLSRIVQLLRSPNGCKGAVLACLGLVSVPVIMSLGGSSVFCGGDEFAFRLMQNIAEMLPASSSRLLGLGFLWGSIFAILAGCISELTGHDGITCFTRPQGYWVCTMGGLLIFAGLHERLMCFFAVASICATASVCGRNNFMLHTRYPALRNLIRACVVTGATMAIISGALLGYSQMNALRICGRATSVAPAVSMMKASYDILQDKALKARTVLATPDLATFLAYYGGFQTVGRMYWESFAGAKEVAMMLATVDANYLASQIDTFNITHVVVSKSDRTHLILAYALYGSKAAAPRATFLADRLAHPEIEENKKAIPSWLVPIPCEDKADYVIYRIDRTRLVAEQRQMGVGAIEAR